MSEQIKHECGIAIIRLLKPIDYYRDKYGTSAYGLNKLYLLMEKQHNRGQDGAGVGVIRLDQELGHSFMARYRSLDQQPIKDIFKKVFNRYNDLREKYPNLEQDVAFMKRKMPFMGELLLGHLRYGTHGANTIHACHPFLRQSNWMTRNLMVAGNFNLTNVDELFDQLVELGQHPKRKEDTITVLEKIGHFLDADIQRIFDRYKDQGYSNYDITNFIIKELDIRRILKRSAKDFDGGYVMAGLIGHGDFFVLRDPSGIRPAYYYKDDEVAVVASERPCIQTTFNVRFDMIKELDPGNALIVKKGGQVKETNILKPKERRACSFERIYFSRGTDKDIYRERQELGYRLAPKVLQAVDHDLENTVFSFIPNTAEVAFYGLIRGVEDYLHQYKRSQITENPNMSKEELDKMITLRPRVEKIAVKDVKMRTFITDDSSRDEMVSHVYDITYGTVKPGTDTLVMIDDSIVRGTTLQKSILSILDRLNPKKIIIVSSAPQIRYPDCYGIDMSQIGRFIAFRAALALLKERGMEDVVKNTYIQCKKNFGTPAFKKTNFVKAIYEPFTEEEISGKIADIVKPKNIFSDVQIVYQSVEQLHQACPNHTGDWYFTGDFPTPGGVKVVNQAFMNHVEGNDKRAY